MRNNSDAVSGTVLEGTFIAELRNRFRGVVSIAGTEMDCYIPSSCRISNFLDMTGHKVLLVPTNSTKAKAKYALFAVEYRNRYILLNTVMANRIVEEQLRRRLFCSLGKRTRVQREANVDGYKCDLYIEDTDTLVEIKSLIAIASVAEVFSVESARAVEQLAMILQRLRSGKRAAIVFVAMSPFIRRVTADKESACGNLLFQCCEAGLELICVSTVYDSGQVLVKKRLSFEFI